MKYDGKMGGDKYRTILKEKLRLWWRFTGVSVRSEELLFSNFGYRTDAVTLGFAGCALGLKELNKDT